jgi:hypothetical protein
MDGRLAASRSGYRKRWRLRRELAFVLTDLSQWLPETVEVATSGSAACIHLEVQRDTTVTLGNEAQRRPEPSGAFRIRTTWLISRRGRKSVLLV